MKEFRIVPTIKQCDTVKEFCGQLNPSQGDLIFVSGGTDKRYFEAGSYTHLDVYKRQEWVLF